MRRGSLISMRIGVVLATLLLTAEAPIAAATGRAAAGPMSPEDWITVYEKLLQWNREAPECHESLLARNQAFLDAATDAASLLRGSGSFRLPRDPEARALYAKILLEAREGSPPWRERLRLLSRERARILEEAGEDPTLLASILRAVRDRGRPEDFGPWREAFLRRADSEAILLSAEWAATWKRNLAGEKVDPGAILPNPSDWYVISRRVNSGDPTHIPFDYPDWDSPPEVMLVARGALHAMARYETGDSSARSISKHEFVIPEDVPPGRYAVRVRLGESVSASIPVTVLERPWNLPVAKPETSDEIWQATFSQTFHSKTPQVNLFAEGRVLVGGETGVQIHRFKWTAGLNLTRDVWGRVILPMEQRDDTVTLLPFVRTSQGWYLAGEPYRGRAGPTKPGERSTQLQFLFRGTVGETETFEAVSGALQGETHLIEIAEESETNPRFVFPVRDETVPWNGSSVFRISIPAREDITRMRWGRLRLLGETHLEGPWYPMVSGETRLWSVRHGAQDRTLCRILRRVARETPAQAGVFETSGFRFLRAIGSRYISLVSAWGESGDLLAAWHWERGGAGYIEYALLQRVGKQIGYAETTLIYGDPKGTDLADWTAEAIRASVGADVGIVRRSAIGGNIPKGPLTNVILESAYPNDQMIFVVSVPERTLREVFSRSDLRDTYGFSRNPFEAEAMDGLGKERTYEVAFVFYSLNFALPIFPGLPVRNASIGMRAAALQALSFTPPPRSSPSP